MSYYITTPIFYVNAQPHLGHAYTSIIADTISRYKRITGNTVRFQTGTDEHGDKIAEAAGQSGVSPKEYADRISAMFRETWPTLDIAPDHFIRTTDQEHIRTVQSILTKVHDQGDIYFSEYTGLYCKGCERFLTAKELVDGNCPDHLKPPAEIAEQNYFFRMSRYQDWLIDHIKTNPDFIQPERYRNEVLSFLKEPLEDLCISRPTSRLTWGIPLPFDDKFVTYVWFDALINYLTGLGYPDQPDFDEYWPVAEHVIAKDILKPHAIYWPTMLKSLGLPPFRRLHVHGYWNIDGIKMSKSIGNVVGPAQLVEQYGVDATRYFLLREMTFGLDSSFSDEVMITRQNADLSNDLGNLFSRSLTMVANFCEGRVPQTGPLTEEDQALADAATTMITSFSAHMEAFEFNRALQAIWQVISLANKYIVTNAPWELAKDPALRPRLETVLYTLLETLRLITLCLHPIMPGTAARMSSSLGIITPPDLLSQSNWGGTIPATAVNTGPALFPRLKKQATAEPRQEGTPATKKAPGKKDSKPTSPPPSSEGLITFDQFRQTELRVAEIIGAERIAKSDRLLKLTVKAPEERIIVAGIAEHYAPEELPGRKVIIVANLKPTKLMGVESHGMVLAAKEGDRLVLSAVAADIAPGSRVA
ncbi:MAG: methionine--tRNA ligase [Proteobacteria bacterium]|nr:methionine--tRNA ligase [Pseudomonadota bacterium]MBU1686285.1 methionine--tRNA ligase [Pseudomonadota bacterium]